MKVKAVHDFDHNGGTVAKGSILNLPDSTATSLIAEGLVEPFAEAAAPKSYGSGNVTGDSRGGGRTNPGGN